MVVIVANVVVISPSERKFFDSVKELLISVSRESWAEFVRCLELFSCDAITKKDLFVLVQVGTSPCPFYLPLRLPPTPSTSLYPP